LDSLFILDEEDCEAFFCMIANLMWLVEFSWGRSMCVKKREEHGRILYLMPCNGKWLKVVKRITFSFLY